MTRTLTAWTLAGLLGIVIAYSLAGAWILHTALSAGLALIV